MWWTGSSGSYYKTTHIDYWLFRDMSEGRFELSVLPVCIFAYGSGRENCKNILTNSIPELWGKKQRLIFRPTHHLQANYVPWLAGCDFLADFIVIRSAGSDPDGPQKSKGFIILPWNVCDLLLLASPVQIHFISTFIGQNETIMTWFA